MSDLMPPPAPAQLTREQALECLDTVGFPTGTFITNLGVSVPFRVLVVAVGGAESNLTIAAQGPPNSDGTVDRGWLQINSVHGFDNDRLLTDPVYTAACALQILLQQGTRAWAAYAVRNKDGDLPYARRMPPGLGGPNVGVGTGSCVEINKTVQAFLNSSTSTTTKLTVDGQFGARSEQALLEWKRRHHNDGTRQVDGRCWNRMGVL